MALTTKLKKPGTKGAPPEAPTDVLARQDSTQKPPSGGFVPLNFSVPADFKKDFKLTAAMHEKPMTDVLKEGFELYKKAHGMT